MIGFVLSVLMITLLHQTEIVSSYTSDEVREYLESEFSALEQRITRSGFSIAWGREGRNFNSTTYQKILNRLVTNQISIGHYRF